MRSHTKPAPGSKCEKCNKSFRRTNPHDNLCPKCRRRLPTCPSCHKIIAPEYGYMDRPGRKVGKFVICTSCDYELGRKGELHISQGRYDRYLMPDGTIRVEK